MEKTGHRNLMAEDIFFIPKIAQVIPNSTINVVLTKMSIGTTINKKSIHVSSNLSLDITATLTCKEKNTTLNVFSMDLNLQFPVQLGVNNFRLNGKLLNLGGTVTIRNSSIGMIKNEFLTETLLIFPIVHGETIMSK
ncbi:hypothetical protein CHS0354_033882 [Potamilus streckersoni]|uniref:Lipid-binding serum glycoprotein C-terminal domain-containing protein n=1 Tax=Potamilus streckersoni TaxID=2493646 RepID=A0AAE0RWQ6_9BIVA|nr:hypothetical protein CHS0354_033882 [Potamilus streckersoni]